MELLVAVINHAELVDEVLAGFLELGIRGATVLESRGMGRVLSRDVPLLAGVEQLRGGARPENRTIFCVVAAAQAEAAIAMVQEVTGSLQRAGAGIVFTVPVSRVVGLAAELGA